jgi:uncharacterized protein (DUF58 family)
VIYPTRRAILLTAAGAPVSMLIGVVGPGWWLAGVAWIVVVFGLVALDALLAGSRQAMRLDLTAPGSLSVGAPAEVRIEAAFERGRAPAVLEWALGTGERLEVTPRRGAFELQEGRGGVVTSARPVRRGEAVFERLWARWRGPLGLAWKQRSDALEHTAPVTPDVRAVREEAIRLFSRDAPFGVKPELDQGDGSEFQALREFQTGMDTRTIDWKHSARHGALVAKEFRTERNHPMVFAIDTGRLMCEPLGGLPRIDRALNAALLLAYVGLKAGDRVGFFGFGAKPVLSSGAVSGVGAFPLLQKLASKLDYSSDETNFTLGLTQLSGELERRSLVVVFTDFADTTSAELMIENVGRLLRRHLVLFVVFRDEELEALAQAEPAEPDDVSRAVIAAALLRERDLVVARLRRMGVHVVDAPADQMGSALLSSYIDVKRRDLL